MKAWRATDAVGTPGLPADDGRPARRHARVLRYLAKVTIEPAITHGIADHVGSLAAGPPRRHRALRRRPGSGSSRSSC